MGAALALAGVGDASLGYTHEVRGLLGLRLRGGPLERPGSWARGHTDAGVYRETRLIRQPMASSNGGTGPAGFPADAAGPRATPPSLTARCWGDRLRTGDPCQMSIHTDRWRRSGAVRSTTRAWRLAVHSTVPCPMSRWRTSGEAWSRSSAPIDPMRVKTPHRPARTL
jgi:hypothetical protein